MRRAFALALTVVGLFILVTPGWAQPYPSRNVTIIVPYPAGGGVDTVSRMVADKMSKILGQPVVVDLPDQLLIAIQALEPAEEDSLVDELLHSNPAFQALDGHFQLTDFIPALGISYKVDDAHRVFHLLLLNLSYLLP